MIIPDPKQCPGSVKAAMIRWCDDAIYPGGFVQMVLEDTLLGAYNAADQDNMEAMPHIVAYVFNHIPKGCYGSRQRMEQWAETRRKALAADAKSGQGSLPLS